MSKSLDLANLIYLFETNNVERKFQAKYAYTYIYTYNGLIYCLQNSLSSAHVEEIYDILFRIQIARNLETETRDYLTRLFDIFHLNIKHFGN